MTTRSSFATCWTAPTSARSTSPSLGKPAYLLTWPDQQGVLWGPQQWPTLCSHVPHTAVASCTLNIPQAAAWEFPEHQGAVWLRLLKTVLVITQAHSLGLENHSKAAASSLGGIIQKHDFAEIIFDTSCNNKHDHHGHVAVTAGIMNKFQM